MRLCELALLLAATWGLLGGETNGDSTANQISTPGDVVQQNTSVGYLLRLVNASLHTPTALVAWKTSNIWRVNRTELFVVAWVDVDNIVLNRASESANMMGDVFRCHASFTNNEDYVAYVNSTLKTGMSVRLINSDEKILWQGDTCVSLGRHSPFMNVTHFWCYRPNMSVVVENFANIEIIGVTHYPAEYEFPDANGTLIGSYQHPVVRKLSFSVSGRTTIAGADYSVNATLILQCGSNLDIKVDYTKTSASRNSQGQTIIGSKTIPAEFSFSHTWSSSTLGYQYVEFVIKDAFDYRMYTGVWMNVMPPSIHEITFSGADGDNRTAQVDELLRGSQNLESGSLMGYFLHNVNATDQTTADDQFTSHDKYVFDVRYRELGLHQVFSMVWNQLTIEITEVKLPITKVFPIVNVTLTTDKYYGKGGEDFWFRLNATGGTDLICVVDFSDNTTVELDRKFTTILDASTTDTDVDLLLKSNVGFDWNFTKAFLMSGDMMVASSCWNDHSTVNLTTTVFVQKAIVDFVLQPLSPHEFGTAIDVKWDMNTGTNVTVIITYNNISCCSYGLLSDQGGWCTCLITNLNLFDPDTVVDIKAVASNRVSNAFDVIQVTVLEKLVATNLTMQGTTSDFGAALPGLGTHRNKFPVEYPVRFSAGYSGAPPTHVIWSVVCGGISITNNTFSCVYQSPPSSPDEMGCTSIQYEYTFPQNTDQDCTMFLRLENTVGENTLSIDLDLDVSTILQSITNDGPIGVNKTATVTLSFGSFGTNSCVALDLADNSSLLVYGAGAFCESMFNVSEINPNIREEPLVVFTPMNSTTQSIVVPHKYSVIATYDVKIISVNTVSKQTGETEFVIVELDCRYPNVTIMGLNGSTTNSSYPFSETYKSVLLTLTTKNDIDCDVTQLTKTNWTVWKFAEDPRMSTEPPESQQKTVYEFGKPVDVSSPELILTEKSLLFGFYMITARLEMDGLPDVFDEHTLILHVVPTPWLELALTIGTYYEQIYKEQAVFNASASVDPDFDGVDGIEYTWFCRDMNDTVPFDTDNVSSEPLIYVPKLDDLSTFVLPGVDSTGCFGTGRGRLDSTGVLLRLETHFMLEGKYFVITLVASKYNPVYGLKKTTTDIYFHVTLGLPPELVSSCTKNCLSKVNPDEKLILEAPCGKRCYGQLDFTWTLHWYDDRDMPEPFNLTTLNVIPSDKLREMVTNPIKEIGLAFKPNSLVPGRKYVLQLLVMRPNGVFGELRETLMINTAPFDGNCSVYPSHGIAMKTEFNVSCANWKDENTPLRYEYAFESSGALTVFFNSIGRPGKVVTSTNTMPVGDTRNNNELVLYLDIIDSLGGTRALNFTVKVDPPGPGDINLTMLEKYVSNGTNVFDELIKNGDSSAALTLAATMASVLNHINDGGKQNTSEGNETEDKSAKEDAKRRVDDMKQAILKSMGNIEIKDMGTLLQFSGTLKSIIENANDISANTQELAVIALKSSANALNSLSHGQDGFKRIKSAVANIAGSVGKLIMAGTKDSGKENTTMDESAINRIKSSLSVLDILHNATLRYLVANEGPTTVSTEDLAIQTEKVSVKNLGKTENEAANSGFKMPSADVFGLGAILADVNGTVSQLEAITVKVAVLGKNPFAWDSTSKSVTSKVASLDIGSNVPLNVSNLTEEIAITVARDPSQFPPPNSFYMKPGKPDPSGQSDEKTFLKYHCFNRTSNWTSMNMELFPDDVTLNIKVYLKTGGKPDLETGDYGLKFDLPDFSSCNLEQKDTAVHDSKNETIMIDPFKHCSLYPYTIFVSNVDFNTTGQHCFAIKTSKDSSENEDDESKSRGRRSFSCEVGNGKRRVRRSCVIIPPPPPTPPTPSPIKVLVADNLGFDGNYFFPNATPNYNMTMFESSCLYWDEVNETWAGHGCRVGPLTSRSSIQCFCNHLTSFGSDLLVAPNPIDFNSAFANFGSLQDNVAVLALISSILGFYILGVLWARRADKRDLLMLGPTILPNQEGTYHYLITLHTGNRIQSGTTAKVFFKMSGDQDDTVPVKLWDRDRPCYERGQENTFIVSYPRTLGELVYVQIWHNNAGDSPSWYLSRLSVKDLQTDQQWYLICDKWLAVESSDGKVCRVLPVANDQELTNFNQLFTARTIKGLADGHLWFSIFSRPPTSNFTRIQRLSCCLCLLCCTMITSAMFYNMGGEGPSPYAIYIGSLVIDLKQFVIGLQSSIIIIPVNVLLVQIFRNLRPKKEKRMKAKDNQDDFDIENKAANKDSGEDSGEAPKGKLPHCFLYFAYALCYLTCLACIFFTLLYSIQWGKTVSTEWVIAMVTAFLQSVLLLQPVKVVVMAVVFAVLIRKPCDSDEEKNEVTAYEPSLVVMEKTKRRRKSKRTKVYSPPDPETLLQARIIRLKEIKMNAILKEIATFFIFLAILMNVAYYHRDPKTYLLKKTLLETFEEVDAYSVNLGAIYDGDSLWMWARETLVPGLYATEWYNGKKVKKGYLANMEDYLVGVPRVRLLRVEEDSCSVAKLFNDSIPHCYSSYSLTSEDTGSYEVGWEPLQSGKSRKRRDVRTTPETEEEWLEMMMEEKDDGEEVRKNVRQKRAMDPIVSAARSGRNRRKKKRLLSSASPKAYIIKDRALLPSGKIQSCLERWGHQSALDLRGFPYLGTISLYSGSGYPANLGYNTETAYTVIADLHSNGWIEVQTRAVFVEFTVYNANTNLFGIVSIFIEFPSSSSAFTRAQYQAGRFYLHLNFTQTLAHVFLIFFMLYFFYREAKLVRKQRSAYFKGFWNWVEIILVVCEFMTIILFLARLFEVDRNLIQLRENPNDYVGFQYAASADAALCYVLGVLVFFYTLRFMRLLRFNKSFLVIGKVLKRISTPISNFCLPFFIGFIAFGLFAFFVFGSELLDYSTFTMTMVTQFSMTLGDFDFEALVMVDPILGPLYFIAFVGLNVFLLMNIFLAIINDCYAEVQEEEEGAENEYEVLDYVMSKIEKTFAKGTKVAPRKKKKEKKTVNKEAHYVSFQESQKNALPSVEEPMEDSLLDLQSCGKRLDDLLNVIEDGERMEIANDNALLDVPMELRNHTYLMSMLFIESCTLKTEELKTEELKTEEKCEIEEQENDDSQ